MADGVDGQDGFSPVITENSGNNDTTYKLDIITATGSFTTPNLKGQDGQDGSGGGTGGDGFNPLDYSTTDELAVGTWVDGKTLYRKYFTWEIETNQTTSVKWIAHNIENLDTVIKLEGFASYGTTNIPINALISDPIYSGSSLTVSQFNEWLQKNIRIFRSGSSFALFPTNKGGYTLHMFVYYTKTVVVKHFCNTYG